jgi:hypothetical protein
VNATGTNRSEEEQTKMATAKQKSAKAAVRAASPALPKSDEEIMTAEQWAAFDFEPWTHTEDEWKPPVAEKEWLDDGREVLPFVRMAWLALHRTKAELVEGLGKLDDGRPFETMMDGIAHSHEFFENFAKILKAGEARLLCAASAAELRAGNEEAA